MNIAMNKQNMEYSIRDIAKMAGVSIGTVSRILNGADNVDEAIRKRTLEIIASVNYRASRRGRPIEDGSTKRKPGEKNRTIVLLSPGMSSEWKNNDLWLSYFSGIERACQERRYQLMIYMADTGLSGDAILKDVLLRSDGVLLKLNEKLPDYAERLISHLPSVGFGAEPTAYALPQIVLNNVLAGKTITSELIRLGHRRIAFINHVPRKAMFISRSNGYIEAMKEHGLYDPALLLEKNPEKTSESDPVKPESTPPVFSHEVLHLLALPQPPTAVILANDWGALGFMQSCAAAKVAVPETFSVAGIDDSGTWETLCTPPLSTVAMAFSNCAYFATCTLCDIIEGVGTHRRNTSAITYLPGELKIRASIQQIQFEGALA